MSEPITFNKVSEMLQTNSHFMGVYGPKGEELRREEKNQITAIVFQKLKACQERNTDEFYSELLAVFIPALVRQNWFVRDTDENVWIWKMNDNGKPTGMFQIINNMYNQSVKVAIKRIADKPKEIGNVLKEVFSEKTENFV